MYQGCPSQEVSLGLSDRTPNALVRCCASVCVCGCVYQPWPLLRLSFIWGTISPGHGPVPALLIGARFLSPSSALPITIEAQPIWYLILTPDEPKYWMWLLRVEGRFNHLVGQAHKQKRSVSLSNQAGLYRDSNPEQVWQMACLFQWSLPTAEANLPQSELQQVLATFFRGGYDEMLQDHVELMSETIKASDLSYTKSKEQLAMEQGAAHRLQMMEASWGSGECLTQAQEQGLTAQLNQWLEELESESQAHTLLVQQQQAWDTKSQADLRRTTLIKEGQKLEAVKAEASIFYQSGGFSDLRAAIQFQQSRKVALADFRPPINDSDVPVVLWIDLAECGLGHSNDLKQLTALVQEHMANSPSLTTAVVFPPNTPKFGMGARLPIQCGIVAVACSALLCNARSFGNGFVYALG